MDEFSNIASFWKLVGALICFKNYFLRHLAKLQAGVNCFKIPTRRCLTVRNSDDQAIPLRWACTPFCIYQQRQHQQHQEHQQHQRIGSIITSVASAHQ